ncbi:MAG: hypothetical protein JW957_00170 [Candidatus Omnitrophica bacterium]|nr:hypothetical protein [Candidatus Omnitrophota bacterium]
MRVIREAASKENRSMYPRQINTAVLLLAELLITEERFVVKTARRDITHIANPMKKKTCMSILLLYPESFEKREMTPFVIPARFRQESITLLLSGSLPTISRDDINRHF